MGRYLLTLPPEMHKYMLVDEKGNEDRFNLPVFAHPTYYLTYNRVANLEIVRSDTTFHGPGVFLMLNYNDTLAEKFLKFYPNASIDRIDMNGPIKRGGDFNVILLPEQK